METSKPSLQSKTIVSALAGGLLTIGLLYGVVEENEVESITTLIMQMTPYVLQLAAFLGAIYGRIKAKTTITIK